MEVYRSTWRVVDAVDEQFQVDLNLKEVNRLKNLEYSLAQK